MSNRFLDAALGYIDHGFSVVILGKEAKEPVTAHTPNGLLDATRDEDVARRWWSTTPKCNVGIVCGAVSGGIVVIDIDTKKVDGYESMRDWEMEHGDMPETVTCCTPTGGYHLYYHVDRPIAPSTNDALGIDIRGDGSFVVAPPSIHPDTKTEYVWETPPDELEIAEANELVYEFIEYVRPDEKNACGNRREKVRMPTGGKKIHEGEGRNVFLYEQGCSLRGSRDDADDDFVASWLETLNKTYCRPPVDDDELNRIIKSVCKNPVGPSAEVRAKMSDTTGKGKSGRGGRPRFEHEKIARRLIAENGACMVDGMPAIRRGNVYEIGWDAVSREIIKIRDDATRANQKEVHHYIAMMGDRKQQSPPNLIAFRNGVLDITGGTLTPWDKTDADVVIPNIIPHDYDPAATFPEVEKTLLKISCDESDVLESLIEVMGVCMYRSNEFTQSAILLGDGSNGKSTYLRMLMNMLGRDNIASLDMSMLGKQFFTGHLAGKLANLGDDISNEFQRGDYLSIFKKLVDGNRVYADVKGTEGFEFESYATLVFSANEFPRLADYSYGMMRRIFPVEFNAHFDKADSDYDPRISFKLRSEAACQSMCSMAVDGLMQVIDRNGFTPNAASSRRVEEIRADNDTSLAWANDNGWDSGSLDGQPIPKLYSYYREWCINNGLEPVKRTKFTRRMNVNFSLESIAGRVDGAVMKCFRKK